MRKGIILVLVFIGLTLSGCSLGTTNSDDVMDKGRVEIRGQLSTKVGNEWVFIKDGGEVVNVTSQKIDLGQYEGQIVTLDGMFSGSTLYVDSVSN